ncbi:hypothetical protein [Shinella kummerowiae]|uniref:hypothetical protein n=1 Tax=Shinella kummerowiae TaxID=417745 RepID=UPI003B848923
MHNIITTILSTLGLFLGVWVGYELAGILGAITFAPVGALVGFAVSVLHIRLLMFLD